jgi:hypothetical protein
MQRDGFNWKETHGKDRPAMQSTAQFSQRVEEMLCASFGTISTGNLKSSPTSEQPGSRR